MSNPLLPAAPALNRRKVLVHTAAGALAASVALPRWAHAQAGPIRIVVGYPPGGASDRAARLVGERMQQLLQRPVIVDNRVGAGGRLAAQQLVNTPVDQTLLMMANPAVMSVAPLIYKDLKYDAQKDFVPVAAVTDYDFGVAVSNALPVKEVSHMLAWIRANPDKANAGVPATGSLPHFFALMLSYMAQAKIEVVGYRGSAPLLNDLIGGQIPLAFDTLDSLLPQHEGGKLRVLATSGAKRSPFTPNVPTFKEQGLPLTATGWNTLFAPATTPKATVALLGRTVFQIMSEPDVQAKLAAAKMVPVAMTQAQTAAAYQAFNAQWSPVIRRSGFKPDA
ncbi:ABC transporter substrate-binding protein [Polaromonas sp. P1-6]|nr:ABC transporter substrate-binding protein [Polaromonas sp. P1-6]